VIELQNLSEYYNQVGNNTINAQSGPSAKPQLDQIISKEAKIVVSEVVPLVKVPSTTANQTA
jgi:hypothetical protein